MFGRIISKFMLERTEGMRARFMCLRVGSVAVSFQWGGDSGGFL